MFAKSESCLSCHCYPPNYPPPQATRKILLLKTVTEISLLTSFLQPSVVVLLSLPFGKIYMLNLNINLTSVQTRLQCTFLSASQKFQFILTVLKRSDWSTTKPWLRQSEDTRSDVRLYQSRTQMLAFVVQLSALLSSRPFCSKDSENLDCTDAQVFKVQHQNLYQFHFCYCDTDSLWMPQNNPPPPFELSICDPTFPNESHLYFLSFSDIYITVETRKCSFRQCQNYLNQLTSLVIIIIWSCNHHSISFWEISSFHHTVLGNKWVHV